MYVILHCLSFVAFNVASNCHSSELKQSCGLALVSWV